MRAISQSENHANLLCIAQRYKATRFNATPQITDWDRRDNFLKLKEFARQIAEGSVPPPDTEKGPSEFQNRQFRDPSITYACTDKTVFSSRENRAANLGVDPDTLPSGDGAIEDARKPHLQTVRQYWGMPQKKMSDEDRKHFEEQIKDPLKNGLPWVPCSTWNKRRSPNELCAGERVYGKGMCKMLHRCNWCRCGIHARHTVGCLHAKNCCPNRGFKFSISSSYSSLPPFVCPGAFLGHQRFLNQGEYFVRPDEEWDPQEATQNPQEATETDRFLIGARPPRSRPRERPWVEFQ